MELPLQIEFENLYGGDGNIRYEDRKQIKLTRTKSKRTTKSTTGLSTNSGVEEEQYEIVKTEIQTFKIEEDKPTYRFGGIHGKLWGHLKACGKMLADEAENGFDSKAFIDRVMMSVNISPVNVIIEDFEPMQIGEIPCITAGISRAMIIQKFDFLPKCKVDIKLTFPDMHKDRVLKILKRAEEVAGMNKRRATMKILNREIFK